MPLTPNQIAKINELINNGEKRPEIMNEVVRKMGADARKVEEYLATRFKALQDLYLHEQAFYWQRFAALAALNAGFFVLATSKAIERAWSFEWFGVGLGLVWVLIQGKSLQYVNRVKPQYHALRENIFGIKFAELKFSREGRSWSTLLALYKFKVLKFLRHRRLSSTWLAFYATIVVLLLWLLVAISVLKWQGTSTTAPSAAAQRVSLGAAYKCGPGIGASGPHATA